MLDLVQNVVTGIAAAVVTMLVGYYLVGGREPEPLGDAGSSPHVLRYFAQRSAGHAVIASLLLTLIASLMAALLAGVSVGFGAKNLRSLLDVLSFANGHAWSQLSWAFWNYLVWGALSWFLVAFARHSLTPDVRVFATAGLLGGFHHIMAILGIHYIGRLVLGDTTVTELYALRPAALTRMWLPYFMESISAGILLAYYLTIASNRPIARGLYRLRYKILTVILVVLGLNYPAVLAVEEGSFIRTALGYQNTGIVWWGCLGAGVSGLILGTALYDLIVRRTLSVRQRGSLGSGAESDLTSRSGPAEERAEEPGKGSADQRTPGIISSPLECLGRDLRHRRQEVQESTQVEQAFKRDAGVQERARETRTVTEEAAACGLNGPSRAAFLAASLGAFVGAIVALRIPRLRDRRPREDKDSLR